MKDHIDIQPILKFNKRYNSAITSKSKEIRLTIEEAGLLNSALSSLLSVNISEVLNGQQESNNPSKSDDVIDLKLDAGSFKD